MTMEKPAVQHHVTDEPAAAQQAFGNKFLQQRL